jgi:glyoxylate reductase
MSLPRVFVSRALPGDAVATLREQAEVDQWADELPPPHATLLARLRDADGAITLLTDRIDAALLAASPRLRVVSNVAVGYDNIDVAACTAAGVLATNTPGVLTETTADFAFALLMAGARRVVEGDAFTRAGRWRTWDPSLLLGTDVWGATLGVVGLGLIGEAMARRGRGFGMRVLYANRSPRPALEAELGLEPRELDALLAEADFVSLHLPLTAETRHLIDARRLALLKPSAVLINTARGPIVDQQALAAALRAGRPAAAALDVSESEPIAPDDPLLALPNCIITPHIGSASLRTRALMASMAVANALAALRGDRPANLLNPEALGRRPVN